MISQRAQNIVASVTGELSAKVTELKAQGKDVIKLNIGEPDFRPPENIAEAAIAASAIFSGGRKSGSPILSLITSLPCAFSSVTFADSSPVTDATIFCAR